MRALAISICIHLLILFGMTPDEVLEPQMLDSKKSSAQLSINVTFEIEDEIKNQQSSISKKVAKKVLKKKKRVIKRRPENKKPKKQAKQIRKKATAKSVAKKDYDHSKYVTELNRFIESHKYYPRAAARMRQHGTVQVKVRIDRLGNFKSVEIVNKSQFRALNKAAVQLVSELKKFKPLPREYSDQVEFLIPISYTL